MNAKSGNGVWQPITPRLRLRSRRLSTLARNPVPDTYIASATPSTNYSGANPLKLGYSGGNAMRLLLDFDHYNNPPHDLQIQSASVDLNLVSATNPASIAVSAYALTRDCNAGTATWNNADTGTAWTTPGGDFNATAESTTTVNGNTPGDYTWDVTSLVRSWLAETANVHGVLLKEQTESGSTTFNFDPGQFALDITYQPTSGDEQSFYTMLTQPLTDGSQLEVNAADGGLTFHAHDLHLSGIGLDLNIDRYWNSFNASYLDDLPSGWSFNTGGEMIGNGSDVELLDYPDGSVVFQGPDHYAAIFEPNGNGGYTAPPGVDATLTINSSGDDTVSFHGTGVTYGFITDNHSAPDGAVYEYLDWQRDKHGNSIDFNSIFINDTRGNNTTFDQQVDGYVHGIDDPFGRHVGYGYGTDAGGAPLLTGSTDLNGKTSSYGYDNLDNLSRITDPNGNVTDLQYDGWGRVTSIKRYLDHTLTTNATTTFSYVFPTDASCPSGLGGETKVTDARNNTTIYCSDSQGRVVKVIDPDGHSFSTDYSSGANNCGDNNPCSTTDALGKTTTYGYYPASTGIAQGENLNWQQSPLEGTNNRPTFAYGDSNNPYYATQYTNPQSHSWAYSYDQSTGDLSSGGPSGQTPVRFTYNSDGTLATATDGKGNQTSYGYDPNTENLTSVTQPSPLGSISLSYDSMNRIHTITDGKGQTRTYTYDNDDRVTQIAYTNGPTLTYSYDADGNLTASTDPTGDYGYTYDALNRLTQETQPGNVTIGYGYDNNSNLTSLTDASGTTNYTYTKENEVATELEPGASNAIQFSYDANGNRTQTDYPNGVSEYISYDNAQRIVSVVGKKPASGTIITASCYIYSTGTGADTDLRQSVTNVSSTITGCPSSGTASTTTYSYDTLDRLSQAQTPTTVYQYLYDADGNICAKY